MSSPIKLNSGSPSVRPVTNNLVLNAENKDVEREQLNRILASFSDRINALSTDSGTTVGTTTSFTNNDGTISLIQGGNTLVISIAESGVGTFQLANSGVTTSKIADEAITTVKIDDDAVTTAKLATVNSNVGSFGTSSAVSTVTVNAEGQVTAVSNTTISIPASAISDGTTVGRNLLTASNPSAITFIRINADNSVTFRSASDFRGDLSLGTMATQAAADYVTVGTTQTISGAKTFSANTTFSANAFFSDGNRFIAATGGNLLAGADGAGAQVQIRAEGSIRGAFSAAGLAVTGALSYTGTLTGGTGVINIGSGQVYKDASGNVGIGTTTLSDALELGTTTTGKNIRLYSSSYANNGLARFYGTDGAEKLQMGTLSATGAYVFAPTSVDLVLFAHGAEKARADANGLAVNGAIGATGTVSTGTYTVGTLPAGTAGMRAFVTDANATTFASIVVGGGANGVPVYYDSANWRIG